MDDTPIASEDVVTFPGFILALVFVAASPLQTPDGMDRARPLNDDLHRLVGVNPGNPEPPATTVSEGDLAPDFSFESHEHQWLRLHDLVAQGNILLVFGPGNQEVAALERERDALLERGIVPVAVLDRRDGAVWGMAQRLGLRYSLLSDPQCVIATQFNVLHPTTHRPVPSWFVIDRAGRVRALRRTGLPGAGYLGLAATALGLPLAGATVPTGTH